MPAKRKVSNDLEEFGRFLRGLRERQNLSQQEVAARIKNPTCPQSVIAQYEKGRVADPNPQLLSQLAAVYNTEFMEIVRVLVEAKYAPPDGWTELDRCRFRLFEKSVTRFQRILGAKVTGPAEVMEIKQLRAKAALVEHAEVLDLEGIAEWLRDLDPLREVWVIVPSPTDGRRRDLYESLVHNLKRGVTYVYFLGEDAKERGGKWWQFLRKLQSERELASIPNIQDQLVTVILQAHELANLIAGSVIANPFENEIGVYSVSIRGERYGIRIDPGELDRITNHLGKLRATPDRTKPLDLNDAPTAAVAPAQDSLRPSQNV